MANASILKTTDKIISNFQKLGWPNSLIISGEQVQKKFAYIQKIILNELLQSPNTLSLKQIQALLNNNEHPDYFIFNNEVIKIGTNTKKKEGQNTVRFLKSKFIPYAPKYSKKKFILFKDASLLTKEAENALLKIIEEPPEHTHFILLTRTSSKLTDTIRSRSIEIRFFEVRVTNSLPTNSWQLFWHLSENHFQSDLFSKLKEINWYTFLEEQYDQLVFNTSDYKIFYNIAIKKITSFSEKEFSFQEQSYILKISFLPIYFSIRDQLTRQSVEPLAPISLPIYSPEKLSKFIMIFHDLFYKMNKKYYGTIPPSLKLITINFLIQLIKLWPKYNK